jgi:16S rRNA (cytosine967-C5)-methyltransferase
MPSEKPTSARAIAADVLNQFDPKRNYASAILHKLLHKTAERQRATDLACGALRNLAAIDMMIAKLTDCPTERIQTKVLNIIRIGAYELIYSPATPGYSIVNEAVENAKAVVGKRQTGFINAALRQITRHIIDRQTSLAKAISQRTLPQTPATGCEFDTDILPDQKTSPADYLYAAFSLPKWLITNWLDEYGADSAQQICFASNRRPSIYIRPNTLKTTTQKLAEKLQQENIDCEIVESAMIKLKSPKDVTELPGFAQGEFSVQDITAAQPVNLLKPQPSWKILDLCTAPGTKTTQLAEATGDKAQIFATDIDPQRLEKVNENITRLSLKSIKIIEYEQLFHNSKFSILNSKLDAVLLDVPCSNTGVLAKRIETRYRITPKAIKELTKIQVGLLKTAASLLKPKGRICYSTCSIQKQENQQLMAEFLKKNPDFELESEKLILPSAESPDCDGGYVAIIIRKQ